MSTFEDLFLKSKGQPVTYKGQVIQMVDRLRVDNGQAMKIAFESVNSSWRQGICLTTDGSFEVNSQKIKKSVVLWHDTAPVEVLLKVWTNKGECQVKNVWDVGDGVMHSWHNGAAMIVEEFPAGRRYRCNDGRADEDFDDIIFNICLKQSY
jgi:hypothetical protein